MIALRRIALAAVVSIGFASVAAQAGDPDEEKWETRIIADKPGPVTLAPDKAYILVHADYVVMPQFMRVPSASETAVYADRRAAALAKEHGKWEKRYASWLSEMKSLASAPKSVRRPAKPQEPTEENFGFPEYEQVHAIALGPQNRFSKVSGSVYLQEIPPGEYLFYGSTGACACLGTVAFQAPAGKIVAVDFMMPLVDAIQSLPKEQRPKDAFGLPPGVTSFALRASQFRDPRLPEGSLIAPTFRPVGTRPNWFGTEVDRVMPMEGVFRYERDKQIDLRQAAPTSEPAASAAGASAAGG